MAMKTFYFLPQGIGKPNTRQKIKFWLSPEPCSRGILLEIVFSFDINFFRHFMN